jgi:hypothetical protein
MAITEAQRAWASNRVTALSELDAKLRAGMAHLSDLLGMGDRPYVTIDAAQVQQLWAAYRQAIADAANALPA